MINSISDISTFQLRDEENEKFVQSNEIEQPIHQIVQSNE